MAPQLTTIAIFIALCCGIVLSHQNNGHTHPDLADIVAKKIGDNIHFQSPSSFGATYYVSTTGNDNNSGSMSSPFLTLNGARNAIRNLNSLPIGGVLVYIREGMYMNTMDNIQTMKDPLLTLSGKTDSGSSTKPIVYSGYPNENVKILGGFKIDNKYFMKNGSNSFLVADLNEIFGAKVASKMDLGSIQTQSLGLCNNFKSDLYLNDQRLTLARYPNTYQYYDKYTDKNIKLFNWTSIVDNTQKNKANSFIYDNGDIDDERAKQWLNAIHSYSSNTNKNGPWLHGYTQVDWADNYCELTGININDNSITTSSATPPIYPYTPNGRYYVTNVLTELDTMDEYWIDTENKLIFLHENAITENDNIFLSYSPKIFDINNVSFVSIQNLTFSYSTMSGLHVNNSNNITISGLSGLGHNSYAMEVSGNNNTVYNNEISSIGCVGISINGGNIYTLERGNNEIIQNNVTYFSEWKRTYNPGIAFGTLAVNGIDSAWGYPSPDRLAPNGMSVGNSFIGNYLGFSPHQCMYGFCNDNLFEYNTFERCVYETTDSGAWYSHFGWVHRGSLFQHNLFINIYNLQDMPSGVLLQEGIYLDDEISGYRIINNTFVRTRFGVYMGGGRSNILHDNYFSNTEYAVNFVDDGLTWEQDACKKGGEFNIELDQVNYQKPPWSTHYGSEVVNIYNEKPCYPIYVNISYNYYCVPSDCLWSDTKCKTFINQNDHTINSWGSTCYDNTETKWSNQYC